MSTLFSYVVDHDLEFSPNPYGGFCTLAHCKFSISGKKNIVELANVGDWVAGTGGLGPQTAGHGKIIYAMRISEIVTLKDHYQDIRFRGRADNLPSFSVSTNRWVLISKEFFYFGANAVSIGSIPTKNLAHPFEKKGPSFRRDFNQAFINDFKRWLHSKWSVGLKGPPCGGHPSWVFASKVFRSSGHQSTKTGCTNFSRCAPHTFRLPRPTLRNSTVTNRCSSLPTREQ